MKKFLIPALLLGMLLVCCKAEYEDVIPSDTVYVKADGPLPPNRISFDQGLDDERRGEFWFTPQGSRVLPYDYFTWLEQPDNQNLFRNTDHMSMLGYLPMDSSLMNPSALPIGFAMTRAKSQKDAFVGFTCAACHTNQIDYRKEDGTTDHYLIDGAPTLANFVGFFDQLVNSLNNTHKDPEKFERFAKNVLGDKYTVASAKEELKEELWKWAEASAERQQVNLSSPHLPKDFTSYGRLDAFTNIENAGSAFGLNLLNNRNPTDAPVSYPFLWGTHQSDVVQWNGSAPNKPRLVGPMIRNAGEVVGVFGGLEIKEKGKGESDKNKHTYISNIDFEGLGQLEGFVKVMKAPAWEDGNSNLPALDAVQVAKGAELYAAHCSNCHQVIPSEDQYAYYNAVMVPVEDVGTDPMTSWAAEHNTVGTGMLEGSKAEIVAGDVFTDSTRAINIPVNGVVGSVLGNLTHFLNGILITEGVKPTEQDLRNAIKKHIMIRDSMVENRPDAHDIPGHIPTNTGTTLNLEGLKYKARPLNGIWATAPYLHNGSVPSLWALLMEPENRPTNFWVGSHEFDPINVGFITDRGKNNFMVQDSLGIIQGNSNLGHDYGTTFSDEEKWALIEYMKSL